MSEKILQKQNISNHLALLCIDFLAICWPKDKKIHLRCLKNFQALFSQFHAICHDQNLLHKFFGSIPGTSRFQKFETAGQKTVTLNFTVWLTILFSMKAWGAIYAYKTDFFHINQYIETYSCAKNESHLMQFLKIIIIFIFRKCMQRFLGRLHEDATRSTDKNH